MCYRDLTSPVFTLSLLTAVLPTVNKLVCSIPHKTLQYLKLRGISLTPAAAVALGRSLSEMWFLKELELIGVDGSILQVEEMEALFGGINQTFPALELAYCSGTSTEEVALLHSPSVFTSFLTCGG